MPNAGVLSGIADPSRAATQAGYAHPLYAEAFREFGEPLALRASGGHLLKRAIGDSGNSDAMGLYPLFCCADWNGVAADLDALHEQIVSVVLVADPFGDYDHALLEFCFDRVRPFKEHHVVDLEQPGPHGTSHHRYYARRALREVTVEVCQNPGEMLNDWAGLYAELIQRHSITGIQAFSRKSFETQFRVPGLVCFRALDRSGECVGAHLWFVQGEVAYSHLAAANERGYRSACLYALYSTAIEYFHGRVCRLDLGGGAGLAVSADGLTKFKAGWANTTQTAYLCGRILNARRYAELCAMTGTQESEYLPAYRSNSVR